MMEWFQHQEVANVHKTGKLMQTCGYAIHPGKYTHCGFLLTLFYGFPDVLVSFYFTSISYHVVSIKDEGNSCPNLLAEVSAMSMACHTSEPWRGIYKKKKKNIMWFQHVQQVPLFCTTSKLNPLNVATSFLGSNVNRRPFKSHIEAPKRRR